MPVFPATKIFVRCINSPAQRSSFSNASSNARSRSRVNRPQNRRSSSPTSRNPNSRPLSERRKSIIAAGDIYQVVLSQRFAAQVGVDPFMVYRALRHVNPSPYMFFVRMGARTIVGSSPEMLVRVEGRRAETHPIAGTRPRGRTEEEDQRLGDEAKRNEKERAEHVMLVDLGRNDLGRVCSYGTVRVPTFMALERYSHVMHLVSVVEGQLADDQDRLDALVACFPAGTVSARRKCAQCRSSTSSSPHREAFTPARSDISTSPATSTSVLRFVRLFWRRVARWCRLAPASSPTRTPPREHEETRDKARAMVRALELALGPVVVQSSKCKVQS